VNEYLLRMIHAIPFEPFTILMQGGHVFDILSRDFIAIEDYVQQVTAYDPAGHRAYLDVSKIVGLRTIHPVEE
jgi:hypothetical protein